MTQRDQASTAEWRVAEAFARIQERRKGGRRVPVVDAKPKGRTSEKGKH